MEIDLSEFTRPEGMEPYDLEKLEAGIRENWGKLKIHSNGRIEECDYDGNVKRVIKEADMGGVATPGNEYEIRWEDGRRQLYYVGVHLATFTPEAHDNMINEMLATLNSTFALPEQHIYGGESMDSPTNLYNHEGIIYTGREGGWFSNQTGGCSCNHPKIRGEFVIYAIPEGVKDALYDCSYADDAKLDKVDEVFSRHRLGWKVNRDQCNEEAWLHVTINGEEAILTWQNSD